MTKQEKIREGIAESEFALVLRLANEHEFTMSAYKWEELEPRFKEYYYYRADQILSYLHSQGVVIKVDTAKPPIFFSREITVDSKQLATIVENLRDTYDKAGYIAAEQLLPK